MLSTLSSIDLLCFDFILSRQTNPEILCSNLSLLEQLIQNQYYGIVYYQF